MNAVTSVGLPWTFSQQPLDQPPLLQSADFCRAARDRGITIDKAVLRELYRLGLLLPLLEVRARRVRSPITEPLADEAERSVPYDGRFKARQALKAGRLTDPDVDRRRRPPAFWPPAPSSRWWDGLP